MLRCAVSLLLLALVQATFNLAPSIDDVTHAETEAAKLKKAVTHAERAVAAAAANVRRLNPTHDDSAQSTGATTLDRLHAARMNRARADLAVKQAREEAALAARRQGRALTKLVHAKRAAMRTAQQVMDAESEQPRGR
eukprot:TRINITY_DN6312_c0_g1_i3.p2 TRINITY_DN6312_c0_g1~~TRINITY_DN6312_c0_g1_i3.p2  ORF type:complete len:138 (-),score=33.22 TRINITY_DN6312_c0_g1_i3:238-651(-)